MSPGRAVAVEHIRAGDPLAFEALFHEYHGALCAFAYRYLGARDLAEEVVQEVFLLGNEVTTQADVLAEIDLQRQLELAFEGDRWPDLVRTGRAVEVLGIPEFQTLYPIPQTEIDVAPGITQNPGY